MPFLPPTLRKLVGAVLAAGVLAGCVNVRPAVKTVAQDTSRQTEEAPGRYIVSRGQFTENVAELRAQAAPALADITPGSTIHADERRLAAKSFVRVGTVCYRSDDDAARGFALTNGTRVGADKILFYTRPVDAKAATTFAEDAHVVCTQDAAAPEEFAWPFVATLFVRYKLPFGAQFRTMTAPELKSIAVDGGVQLGAIVLGTPAAEANLRSGDFVLRFNGSPIANRAAFEEMLRANMGKRVTMSIARNGDQFDRILRLGVIAIAER